MPPPLFAELSEIDLDRVVLTKEQIYELLPHRFEFMVLDGICFADRDRKLMIAFSDIRQDAWWFRGHVPGRPLFPGALMLEMAAQTSAVAAKTIASTPGFLGFGGVTDCRFRDSVAPPARLYIICVGIEFRPRRVVSVTQGVVDGKLVFEAKITGLIMR